MMDSKRFCYNFTLLLSLLFFSSIAQAHIPISTPEDHRIAPEDPLNPAKIKEILGLAHRQIVRDFYHKLLSTPKLVHEFFKGETSAAENRLTDEEFMLIQLLAVQDKRLHNPEIFPEIPFKIDFDRLGKDWIAHFIRLDFFPAKHVIYRLSSYTFDNALTYFTRVAKKAPEGIDLIGFEHETFTRPVTLLDLLERVCHDADSKAIHFSDNYQAPVKKVQQALKIFQNHFERRHFLKLKTLHLNLPFKKRYNEPKLRLSHEGEILAAILLSLSKHLPKMEDVHLYVEFINDRDRTDPQPIWVKLEKFLVSPDQYEDKMLLKKLRCLERQGEKMPPLYHYRLASPMGFIETAHISKLRTTLQPAIRMLDHRALAFRDRRKKKQLVDYRKGKTLPKKEAAKTAQPTRKPQQPEDINTQDSLIIQHPTCGGVGENSGDFCTDYEDY